MKKYFYESSIGHTSVWLGRFDKLSESEKYISTIYCHYKEDRNSLTKYELMEDEFKDKLNKLFLPENSNRSCEKSFRFMYDESYNRFKYDFGFLFEESMVIRITFEQPTDSLKELVSGLGNQFLNQLNIQLGDKLDKKYNVLIAVPSCKYDGTVKHIGHEGYEVDFIGCVQDDVYSKYKY